MKRLPKIAHIISIEDLSKPDILSLLQLAKTFKQKPHPSLLKGQVLACCFFEPSTRTRLSFETAMIRLGGNVIGFSDSQTTSLQKGETLSDTMRVVSRYSDIIVLRHPLEGSARLAADVSNVPVINAGDGSNQHPTQTLVDLFSIQETQKTLEGLHIGLVGDLKHGRTVHSLALALSHFNTRIYCISPPHLALPDYICQQLKKSGVRFSFHPEIQDVIGKMDILYMTRQQKERHDAIDRMMTKDLCVLNVDLLAKAKKNLKILHPLPRLSELPNAVDLSPHAYYFTQAENGVYVRQSLLAVLLQRTP